MARKIETVALSSEYLSIARTKEEQNDCSVFALVLACGMTYDAAHQTLADAGREAGKAASLPALQAALKAQGAEAAEWTPEQLRAVIDTYPGVHKGLKGISTYHPRRFKDQWAPYAGQVLFFITKDHVTPFLNGQLHDDFVNRTCRVEAVWAITRPVVLPVAVTEEPVTEEPAAVAEPVAVIEEPAAVAEPVIAVEEPAAMPEHTVLPATSYRQARKMAPDAAVIAKVAGGYMAFSTTEAHQAWKLLRI